MDNLAPKPSSKLTGYIGPFSRHSLEQARKELIDVIDEQDSYRWKVIRRKVGIKENGKRDRRFSGWGRNSTLFSHQNLSQEVLLPTESTSNHVPAHFPQDNIHSDTVQNPEIILLDDTPPVMHETSEKPDLSGDQDIFFIDRGADRSTTKKTDKSVVSHKQTCFSSLSKEKTEEISEQNDFQNSQIQQIDKVDQIDLSEDLTSVLDDEVSTCSGTVVFVDSCNSSSRPVMNKEDRILRPGLNRNDQSSSPEWIETYLCDFCFFASENQQEIRQHLASDIHFTASKYMVSVNEKKIFLLEELSIMCKEAGNASLVARCPACCQCFSTTFECSYHHLQHEGQGNEKPSYMLAKIIDRKEITDPSSLYVCAVCKLILQSEEDLEDHVNSNNHGPRLDNDKYLSYSCSRCQLKCPYTPCNHWSKISKNHPGTSQTVSEIHQYVLQLQSLGRFYLPSKMKPFLKRKTEDSSKTIRESRTKRLKLENVDCKTYHSEVSFQNNSSAECIVISDDEQSEKAELSNVGLQDLAYSLLSADRALKGSLADRLDSRVRTHSSSMLQAYSCDYCGFVGNQLLEINNHLKNLHHASASVVLVNEKNEPVSLSKPSVIKQRKMLKMSVMITCPFNRCFRAFDTPLDAAEHYRIVHDRNEGFSYGLSEVVTYQPFSLLKDLHCEKCDTSFPSLSKFRSHFRKMKDHLPDYKMDGTFAAFKCDSCCVWSNSCQTMLNHCMIRWKEKLHICRNVYSVSKIVTAKKLLPFTSDKSEEILNYKMMSLQRLQKSGFEKKLIKKEKMHLKDLLLELKH